MLSAPLQVIPTHLASTSWKWSSLISPSMSQCLEYFYHFHTILLQFLWLQIKAHPKTEFCSLSYSGLIIFGPFFFHACWYWFQDPGCQLVIKLRGNGLIQSYLFSPISTYTKLHYLHFSKCTVSLLLFIGLGLNFFSYMYTELPFQPSFERWYLSCNQDSIPSYKQSN